MHKNKKIASRIFYAVRRFFDSFFTALHFVFLLQKRRVRSRERGCFLSDHILVHFTSERVTVAFFIELGKISGIEESELASYRIY